ncbi:AcrB/AcrD/AcrF family protein, partial [Paenibacillus validus]
MKAHDETKPSRFTSFYENVLKWTLMNRIKTLLISGLLFVVTLAATIPMLNVSFLPSSEASRTMYFSLKFPYETSFEATDEKTRELENMLMETKDSRGEPVFKFVEGLVGYSGNDDERTPYASQIYLEVNENVDPDKV